MRLKWRDLPVLLTWQTRIGTPVKEWSARFMEQVRESDAAGESIHQLTVRLGPLAAEMGATPEIRSEPGKQPMLTIRLVVPTIQYLAGAAPPRIVGDREVVFVGGPRSGDREHRDALPRSLRETGGQYRRSVRCAIDDGVRYVWESDPN